jgi:hypothetical protein
LENGQSYLNKARKDYKIHDGKDMNLKLSMILVIGRPKLNLVSMNAMKIKQMVVVVKSNSKELKGRV